MYEFDWSSIIPSLPYLLAGLVITLKITVTAVVVGIVWGTILAVMRLSSFAPIAWFAKAYVNVFRSIPLVMVLLWFYLIVPGFLQNVLGLSPKRLRQNNELHRLPVGHPQRQRGAGLPAGNTLNTGANNLGIVGRFKHRKRHHRRN